MHDVIYKHPNDKIAYTVDFTDELTGDSSISASSAVTAVDSDDANASSTVVGTVSETGMVLSAILQAGTDGEDYRVSFKGVGTTTTYPSTKVVEMRVRSYHLGNI